MTHIHFTALAFGALLFILQPAIARDMIIGLSPYAATDQAQDQAKQILGYVLNNMKAGDRIMVYDAYNARVVATFQLSPDQKNLSVKKVFKANARAAKGLADFGKATRPNSSTLSGGLRVPHFLRHLHENGLIKPDTAIILIGSPLYIDLLEPNHAMHKAQVPSDGMLQVSADQSPYGVSAIAQALSGQVYWVTLGDWAVNSQHSRAVKRFWTLLLNHTGLALANFQADLPSVMEAAFDGRVATPHGFRAETDGKLLMRRYIAQRAAQVPIFERSLTTAPLTTADLRSARDVEISLRWNCTACDLDLYVRVGKSGDPVYYANPATMHGRYIKDRETNAALNGLEIIRLNGSVDLTQTKVGVNFFQGETPTTPLRFELRLSFGGKTYLRELSFDAHSGKHQDWFIDSFTNNEAYCIHGLSLTPLDFIAGNGG